MQLAGTPAPSPSALAPDLTALTGAPLARALGEQTASGHIAHSYQQASDELYASIDDVTGSDGVLDAYTGVVHLGVHDRQSAKPRNLSVEHTWPRSHGATGLAEADLHHLRVADSDLNGTRSSFPFGEVTGRTSFSTSDTPWRSRLGLGATGRRTFEPPDEMKGDIARGMLYFATRYGTGQAGSRRIDTERFLSQLPILLAWHEQDAVTDAERARNDRIADFQGNRNPFVDQPELAMRIGAGGFQEAVLGATLRA